MNGGGQRFQQILVPSGDIQVTVKGFDDLFEGVCVCHAEFVHPVIRQHQLLLLDIRHAGDHIAVSLFGFHGHQSVIQTVPGQDHAFLIDHKRPDLPEHLHRPDILIQLLLAVSPDVLIDLPEIGELLLHDLHALTALRSLCFSQSRQPMANRIAPPTK